MDLDEPGPVVVADAPEGADQVAWLDRPPGPGGVVMFIGFLEALVIVDTREDINPCA
jgi:hypothetical protein